MDSCINSAMSHFVRVRRHGSWEILRQWMTHNFISFHISRDAISPQLERQISKSAQLRTVHLHIRHH
jgi:predicted glycosyl hydrolase (DUF1957 family)